MVSPHAYAYLAASLLGVALMGVVVAVARRQRRMILLSGLLAVCLVPAAVTANDTYWDPKRLGGGAWGIEDILFTFVAGGLAWFFATWPFPAAVPMPGGGAPTLLRGVGACATSLGGYLALWLAGVEALSASLVVHGAVAGATLVWRRSLWPVALSGLLGSAATYFLFLRAVFFVLPEFVGQWNQAGPWHQLVLGVPAGEVLWGGTFGAAWPLLVTYAWRLAPAPLPTPGDGGSRLVEAVTPRGKPGA